MKSVLSAMLIVGFIFVAGLGSCMAGGAIGSAVDARWPDVSRCLRRRNLDDFISSWRLRCWHFGVGDSFKAIFSQAKTCKSP